jgi:signal transduction histidine kinase/ActR/RegA family two-component response regulator
MIVRRSQAAITAVSLGLACVALIVAIALAERSGESGGVVAALVGVGLAGAAGLLFLARWRRSLAEAILQNTIDSVGHGIATFVRGRLVASNTAFADLLALAPTEIAAGRSIGDIEQSERAKPSSVLGDLAIHAKRAEQAGQPVAVECQRADGSILELLYSPHRADGFTLSVTDVTASRRTDDYLRHAQKMEALGQMTGGIAHDFNNFLTVIILNLDYLQNDKGIGEKHARRLRLALDAAFRGSKVVRQLLAFARKQPLEPEVVVLAEVMPGLVELVRRAVSDDIEVEFVSSFSAWHTILDPLQLEAAILNVALNAAAAMPTGGKLTIELASVSLDEAYAARHPEITPGQYILIALSDTGAGMPAETVARAFDPFFTTKPDGHGSGLGLSMVYGFVRQSGGHIKIYSEPGHGTSVKFYFKRSHDDVAQRPELRQRSPIAGKETILVVEDDETLRTTVTATLKELGYAVLDAPHGAAALILLESSNRVDLLFTDVVMPGPVSSGSLVKAAQDLQPAIKILFTSGYTQNAIIHHGRLEPGINFLSKPYRKTQLAEKIRELLATETV